MAGKTITIGEHTIRQPVFMPDATFGFVRGVSSSDLRAIQIQAVVMNTFHLMQKPGSSTIQALGGLHHMADWEGPIVTDSGGFQAYSLIHQNKKFGTITDNGIIFRPEGTRKKLLLSPEKSIQLQFGFGADVLICLDDCTHVDAPKEEQVSSVDRTIAWAHRCKHEYLKQMEMRKLSKQEAPRILAVIQGGGYPELRQRCAEALLSIGFDGFGFGGWPLDANGHLLNDSLQFVRSLVPSEFRLHALGVGHPLNLIACFNMGYDIFDCAMPTRDARHGRLYYFKNKESQISKDTNWFGYKYINDEKHIKSNLPISETCDCPVCSHYSFGYLHHLFKMNDASFIRFATLHNLRFMTQVTQRLHEFV